MMPAAEVMFGVESEGWITVFLPDARSGNSAQALTVADELKGTIVGSVKIFQVVHFRVAGTPKIFDSKAANSEFRGNSYHGSSDHRIIRTSAELKT
eukprot:3602110-Rhodomonas_salina.1